MSGAITAVAAVAVGAGVSIYAANKNSKAIDKANKTNQEIAADTNAANYRMWLESRGVGDAGQAVNTKLPRWMGVNVGGTPRVRKLVKKSEAMVDPYARVRASMGYRSNNGPAAGSAGMYSGAAPQSDASGSAAYAKAANAGRIEQTLFNQQFERAPTNYSQFADNFSGPYNIGKPWWADSGENRYGLE